MKNRVWFGRIEKHKGMREGENWKTVTVEMIVDDLRESVGAFYFHEEEEHREWYMGPSLIDIAQAVLRAAGRPSEAMKTEGALAELKEEMIRCVQDAPGKFEYDFTETMPRPRFRG